MRISKRKNPDGEIVEYVQKKAKLPSSDADYTTSNVGRNVIEDQMIDLMDEVALFKSLEPDMKESLKSKDTKQMLKGSAAWAIAQMVHLAKNSSSDAVKQAALKDLLDRAGYKPVEKQATLNMNELTDGEIDAKLVSALKELELGPKEENNGTQPRSQGKSARSSGTKEKTETKE